MEQTVRVAPIPVEVLATRLDATGLQLSELACRAQAAAADLGCVPAAGRLADVGVWCADAGDALRQLVERARQVDDGAATSVSVAGLGGVWEPPAPARDPLTELGRGAWDSLLGTAETFNDLTVQALWDPAGWWAGLGEVGAGMVASVTDPVGTAGVMIDLDTLQDNPARWAGQLVPDVVAGALSGGTFTAGRRGIHTADALVDSATLPRRGQSLPRARPGPPETEWATRASTGARLDSYIATLPRGRSPRDNIRVLPADHMESLIREVARRASGTAHPQYPSGLMYMYSDATRVGVRVSDRHGVTLDVRTSGERHWKVHIDGS